MFQDAAKEDKKLRQKEEYTKNIEKLKSSDSILRYSDIPWPCEGTVKGTVVPFFLFRISFEIFIYFNF